MMPSSNLVSKAWFFPVPCVHLQSVTYEHYAVFEEKEDKYDT